MSVCLSVCLSHAGTLSKQLHISWVFSSSGSPTILLFHNKRDGNIPTYFDQYLALPRKWWKIELQWPTKKKSYMIFFSEPWKTPTPVSRSRHSLTLNISETVRHIYSVDEILIGTYTPYSTLSFRMTLIDLAKYSMTWSVARSLCDSRVSCLRLCEAHHIIVTYAQTKMRHTQQSLWMTPKPD